ncbi:MAG: MFS transporter [Muribaculaceae bacterium]|nr:MFS transporter [Muribaculaceae bacterium]MBR5686180.1 MFS transporter [Muribaculaceae bacterium]
MKTKPDLKFNQLWNISFGFFGVQIAYALQSANISRIFATLGADPHNLSYFWILPPLMGMVVQPLVGYFSDKTWLGRWGRRIPYLLIGALAAVIVMCLLPNAGSFGLKIAGAMIFGLIALMFLDTSINMAMQPFKMMVGDMVNEKQKAKAYSIQSFLCNAGSLVGYIFPFLFTAIGIANIAPEGVVPDSVKWSFYVGAAILILCVIYTISHVKEYTPAEMAEFNAAANAEGKSENATEMSPAQKKHAIKVFFEVGLVQFFCWAAFMYMWTYTNGTIADTVWGTTDAASQGYQEAGNWVGILFAVQAIGSVLWAVVLPQFKNIKVAYALSLVIGGIGFAMVPYIHNQYLLFVPYFLIGFAWAAMLAMPFTMVTNAFEGSSRMGTALGLFNCTICIPQIVAAALGGLLLAAMGSIQGNMLLLAGILLIVGAVCVFIIEDKKHQ